MVTHHQQVLLKEILEEQVIQDHIMDLVVEVVLVQQVEQVVHHQVEQVVLVYRIQ